MCDGRFCALFLFSDLSLVGEVFFYGEKKEMTKLPEKGLLSGSKTPHTTTGEMKEALGRLRDYLNELLGEDSADKETARQALGIDLKQNRSQS